MPRRVPMVNELSAAAEDCLKAIYKFAGHGGAAAIHDHLARIAASEMLLELLADSGVHPAVHVIVQHRQ